MRFIFSLVIIPAVASLAGGAGLLNSVEIGPESVRLATDDLPSFNQFQTEAPRRLVIDLLDTRLPQGKMSFAGAGPWVKTARASQHTVRPDVTRLVLELAESAPAARFDAEPDGLTVSFPAPAAAAAVPVPALAAESSVPETPQADFGLWETAGTLAVVALTAIGFIARRKAVPFRTLNQAEMIEGAQEAINALSRRLMILEKRVARLETAPGRTLADDKLQSEVRELRAVVASIASALELPERSAE